MEELRKSCEPDAQWILDMLADEAKWDELFAISQDKLAAAGRQAKIDIAAGLAEDFDINNL